MEARVDAEVVLSPEISRREEGGVQLDIQIPQQRLPAQKHNSFNQPHTGLGHKRASQCYQLELDSRSRSGDPPGTQYAGQN